MLVKKTLVVVLGGIFLCQAIAIMNVFRDDADITDGPQRKAALNSDSEAGQGLAGRKNKGNAAVSAIRLNPPVPEQLPDLATGYIFRAERALPEKQAAVLPEDNVNIEDVSYSGSIITGKKKIALVSYQEPSVPSRPVGNVRRGQMQQAADRIVRRLEVHDSIGGYTVADIFPDRLVLTKQGEVKEKYLHDPDKPVARVLKPAVNNVPGRARADRSRTLRKNPPGQAARQ